MGIAGRCGAWRSGSGGGRTEEWGGTFESRLNCQRKWRSGSDFQAENGLNPGSETWRADFLEDLRRRRPSVEREAKLVLGHLGLHEDQPDQLPPLIGRELRVDVFEAVQGGEDDLRSSAVLRSWSCLLRVLPASGQVYAPASPPFHAMRSRVTSPGGDGGASWSFCGSVMRGSAAHFRITGWEHFTRPERAGIAEAAVRASAGNHPGRL
jgi:hypothetical protein